MISNPRALLKCKVRRNEKHVFSPLKALSGHPGAQSGAFLLLQIPGVYDPSGPEMDTNRWNPCLTLADELWYRRWLSERRKRCFRVENAAGQPLLDCWAVAVGAAALSANDVSI